MGISRYTCRKLRYCLLNPNYHLSSAASSSFLLLSSPKTLNPNSWGSTLNPKPQIISLFCSSTTSSSTFPSSSSLQLSKSKLKNHILDHQKIDEIVRAVRRAENQNDLERDLNEMGLVLSLDLDLVAQVFKGLNLDGVSGLGFFHWVRHQKQLHFLRNSDFCSLTIDNLGCHFDDERHRNLMFQLFKEFSRDRLCLTEKAFNFLSVSVFNHSPSLVKGRMIKIIEKLNQVGGSCRNSGIFALIQMLSNLKAFDLAVFVMEETSRTTSYYNLLLRAKCSTCSFQEAYVLFDEMRSFVCDPNTNSYNYLLGSLCKNGKTGEACQLFEKMIGLGYFPNAITSEVIVFHACRLGRLDFALDFLNHMLSRGVQTRHTTHAIIIKSYFYSNRFQEAYKYVSDMCDKCKGSANMNYSLLASLLQRTRRVVEAHNLLVDMIGKGLKPNFPVYIKVLKDLHKSGMGRLVADLKSSFSKLNSRTESG